MAASKQKDNPMRVELISDAHDLRAMHDALVVRRGGEAMLYEVAGPGRSDLVAMVLAEAGFAGSASGSGVKVSSFAPNQQAFTVLRSFEVADGKEADVAMAIRCALAGDLGGFTSVAAAQSTFHRSVFAFEYAWAAAGMPQIRIHQPGLTLGAAGERAPASLFEQAVINPRLAAALRARNEYPETEQEEEAEA